MTFSVLLQYADSIDIGFCARPEQAHLIIIPISLRSILNDIGLERTILFQLRARLVKMPTSGRRIQNKTGVCHLSAFFQNKVGCGIHKLIGSSKIVSCRDNLSFTQSSEEKF